MAVKRSLVWMAASQGVSFVVQFAASVVVARHLTPYELGIYAVAMAVVGALTLIQAMGLGSLIVREPDLTPELVANVFTINAMLALLLSASIAGIGFAGAWFFSDPHVRDVLFLLALAPLPGILDFLPAARFERDGDFRTVSLAAGVRATANAILTMGLVFAGFKFMGLAIAQVLSVLCATLLLTTAGRKHMSFRVSLTQWRSVLGAGVQLLAVASLSTLFTRGADIVLGRLLGLSALGIYNRASSLNALVSDKVRITIERVIFSHFSARSRRGESLKPAYLYTVEMMTAVLWPAFGGMAILAAPIITRIYGERWSEAALPLSLMAIASLIQVSITLTWELFLLNRQLRQQAKIELLRTSVGLGVFTAACTINLTAAAATRVFDAFFATWLYRRRIQEMTDTSFGDFMPIYGRSGLLTALAIAPSAIAVLTFDEASKMPVAVLIGCIIGGIVLWSLGLMLLRHPLIAEVSSALRARRRRDVESG